MVQEDVSVDSKYVKSLWIADRQTDTHAGRQTDAHTGRQTDRLVNLVNNSCKKTEGVGYVSHSFNFVTVHFLGVRSSYVFVCVYLRVCVCVRVCVFTSMCVRACACVWKRKREREGGSKIEIWKRGEKGN